MAKNKTEASIIAAFMQLLDQRPLAKISVRALAAECGISRNTFYYHFRDIPDLMERAILDGADELILAHPGADEIDECIRSVCEFARANMKAVKNIYKYTDRIRFEGMVMRMSAHAAETHAAALTEGTGVSAQDREALACFLKRQCFGVCMDWVINGIDADISYYRVAELAADAVERARKKHEETEK